MSIEHHNYCVYSRQFYLPCFEDDDLSNLNVNLNNKLDSNATIDPTSGQSAIEQTEEEASEVKKHAEEDEGEETANTSRPVRRTPSDGGGLSLADREESDVRKSLAEENDNDEFSQIMNQLPSLTFLDQTVSGKGSQVQPNINLSYFSDTTSSFIAGLEEQTVDVMRQLFRNDPSLHQDILNYVGTRSMDDKILMADTKLLPNWRIQLTVILSFWLVNCGLCCILCAIVGMAMTRFQVTKNLKLGRFDMKVSWFTIWALGVLLIVINFLVINFSLFIRALLKLMSENRAQFSSLKFD